MDADYLNDNSSTDSFIELINMQTSVIITKDKQEYTIFSKMKDCIEPIYRCLNYYIDLLKYKNNNIFIDILNKSKVD
jgi:molecular chaperone DnaK (HSP70)